MSDPLVVYIVVRSDLGMSVGKTCAQVGHSVEYILDHFVKLMIVEAKIKGATCEHQHVMDMTCWKKNGSTKIILKASDKQWNSLKEVFGKECFIVRDAGKTEIAAGTETCMSLWPAPKSKAHALLQELPLL
jgi:peptidyl-tRNA hydrolase, PTH2 family